jgi:hypothetical protein
LEESSARHITIISTFPGTLGLLANYAKNAEENFPSMTFTLNKPMNLCQVFSYRDSLNYLQSPSELVPDDRPNKGPSKRQAIHADMDAPQATEKPMCTVILAPITDNAEPHITPMIGGSAKTRPGIWSLIK